MNIDNLNFIMSNIPDDPDRIAIFKNLRRDTKLMADQAAFYQQENSLTISVKDEHGNLIAGLLGDAFLNAFHLKLFWIDEKYRRQGLGTKMMTLMENQAQKTKCKTIYLDTFHFQAPGFYKKLGYETFGEIEFYANGPKKYFMKKTLS